MAQLATCLLFPLVSADGDLWIETTWVLFGFARIGVLVSRESGSLAVNFTPVATGGRRACRGFPAQAEAI